MKEFDKQWNMKHERMVEFKRQNGHFAVPARCELDKSLGKWVHAQRGIHVNNKMRLDRKRVLDKIGFAWTVERATDTDDKRWHKQHEKLVKFQRKKGNCLVPRRCDQDKTLGQWVSDQRTSHKNNKIRLDQKTILDDIGFAWKDDGPYDDFWHQQCKKLVKFEPKNGNCLVAAMTAQARQVSWEVGLHAADPPRQEHNATGPKGIPGQNWVRLEESCYPCNQLFHHKCKGLVI
jgi:hypothetical protein